MKVKTYEQIFNKPLTIRDLIEDFTENTKTGAVSAYGGKLNIRPPYQREFVYGDERQKAVINTVLSDYPLNTMYWAKTSENEYELMDGQQRTLSICKFCNNQFSVNTNFTHTGKEFPKTFDSLDEATRERVLDYPLTVYICDGDNDEKIGWFETINTAGLQLTKQEMRNAIYNGPWVTNAKFYFSRIDGLGYASEGTPDKDTGHTYGEYVDVVGGANSEKENAVVRQKLFEIALSWAVDAYNREHELKNHDRIDIRQYMDMHRFDEDALELWRYYQDVLEWVKGTFPTYRNKIMNKVDWGILYNEYGKNENKDADKKVSQILASSDEISNPKEVFHAVLSGDIKYLSARAFDAKDKKRKYNEQGGICPYCHKHFELEEMDGDHIIPWSKGGKTEYDNLQMLCRECNHKKSNYDYGYQPWDEKSYAPFDLTKWDAPSSS